MYVCLPVCMIASLPVCMYLCVYVCKSVCMYVCMCFVCGSSPESRALCFDPIVRPTEFWGDMEPRTSCGPPHALGHPGWADMEPRTLYTPDSELTTKGGFWQTLMCVCKTDGRTVWDTYRCVLLSAFSLVCSPSPVVCHGGTMGGPFQTLGSLPGEAIRAQWLHMRKQGPRETYEQKQRMRDGRGIETNVGQEAIWADM